MKVGLAASAAVLILGCNSNSSPPVITSFTATPASLPIGGGTVTLAWAVTNASALSIDQGIGAVTPVTSGSTTAHVAAGTTFTLSASDSAATVTDAAAVCVATGPVTAVATAPAAFDACGLPFQTAIAVTNGTCDPVTVTTITINTNTGCNLNGNYTLNPVPTVQPGQTKTVFNLQNGTICCSSSPCTINCTDQPTWTVTTSAGVLSAQSNQFTIDISNCNQTCG